MDQKFVSREKELGQLGEFLGRAIQGQGQVCFVTGEAGLGKTSLTVEFSRRAQEQHDQLLVAVGSCDAQTGISDPYLPFRELLAMLTGEFDERATQGLTTKENARRLHEFLRISKKVIADVAPDLLDIILPGAGIVTRAGALVARDRHDPRRQSGPVTAAGAVPSGVDASPAADQSRIFEKFTSVLVEMASKRPLILILDDLHWIDQSSASLLFHLARRIETSRILIVGTYRPEDVAFVQSERHPLPKLVSELKRQYGDVFVRLGDETPGEVREFIDALVDSEPNDLDDQFRRQLQQRTRGHPLFATELLRDMQERGDLVRDGQGRWIPGQSLDWTALPARVEGVLEERINRIRGDVQELLTVASVEGETFTVQVISRLKQIDERQLLRTLNQELDRQHRLVSEAGVDRVGTTRISQYRFRHQMFQRYFYDNLGVSERELLHEDVAGALEALYAGRTERVAVQLAYHYDRARLDDKAAAAFLTAARGALAAYASRDATALAAKGIDCLARGGEADRHSGLLIDLTLALGDAQRHDGRVSESMSTFRRAAELASRFGAHEALARAALGFDEPRWRFNLVEPFATTLLERALESIGSEDSVLRVYLLAHLARARQDTMPVEQLMTMLDEAVAMARRLDDPRALIESLRFGISLDRAPERIQWRVEHMHEMLRLAHEIDDKQLAMEVLTFRICDFAALGDVTSWSGDLDAKRRMADEVAEPFYSYSVRAMQPALHVNAGRFADAEGSAMEALATGNQLGVNNVEGVLGMQMFTIRREQGRLREIAPIVKHFVDERGAGAAWRPGLALIYADLGMLEEARTEFERLAADRFSAIARDSLRQTSLCYLAEVCDQLQDADQATILRELLLPYAGLTVVVGNASICLGATSRFLGQLDTARGELAEAAKHFEHALDLNARMDAVTWLAHTKYQYARMLQLRAGPGDVERAARLVAEAAETARQYGMNALISRIGAPDAG